VRRTVETRRGLPTGRGIKPLQRGRAGPESGTTAIADGHRRSGTRVTRRSRKATGHGPGDRGGARPARPHANRKKGERRREATAIPVRSSSEGRTPRTRPVERCRGDRDGSKASRPAGTAGAQRDPEEATPGVVARPGWVASWGNRPRESRDTGGRWHGRPGDTPKRGERPRKARGPVKRFRARRAKTTRWTEPRGGNAEPMRR
jgi:hypothetical protein